MADDKDSVLKNKEEFEKKGPGPSSGGENAKARDEMGQMAEKTEAPPIGSSTRDKK